jgi:hypothetical protein
VLRARPRFSGKQVHSEYGADRTYTGETYAAYSTGQRVQAERPDAALPPSALRRSMSSRVGGMSAGAEETPATKLKRKVSWAGTTVRRRCAPGWGASPSGCRLQNACSCCLCSPRAE